MNVRFDYEFENLPAVRHNRFLAGFYDGVAVIVSDEDEGWRVYSIELREGSGWLELSRDEPTFHALVNALHRDFADDIEERLIAEGGDPSPRLSDERLSARQLGLRRH